MVLLQAISLLFLVGAFLAGSAAKSGEAVRGCDDQRRQDERGSNGGELQGDWLLLNSGGL